MFVANHALGAQPLPQTNHVSSSNTNLNNTVLNSRISNSNTNTNLSNSTSHSSSNSTSNSNSASSSTSNATGGSAFQTQGQTQTAAGGSSTSNASGGGGGAGGSSIAIGGGVGTSNTGSDSYNATGPDSGYQECQAAAMKYGYAYSGCSRPVPPMPNKGPNTDFFSKVDTSAPKNDQPVSIIGDGGIETPYNYDGRHPNAP